MTYELIILERETGNAWDAAPQVQSVTYTTNRTGSPGTLKFTVNAYNGLSFIEGDPVRFSVDGRLIFLGWVFTKTRDRHAVIEVTCYDQLRYLKASASYCFTGRTAGEIITEIAQDFQLTVGHLDDTGYPIPTLIMEEKSCLDIISTAIQRTLLAAGTLYTFFDDGGALSLREAGSMVAEGVVGAGSLLTDYQYKTDIDQQTYNSIKLARPNESTGKADVFQVMDSGNISRYTGGIPGPRHAQVPQPPLPDAEGPGPGSFGPAGGADADDGCGEAGGHQSPQPGAAGTRVPHIQE